MDNSVAASNYAHKKFNGALKRKRSQDDDESDDVIFVCEIPAKRRFFRPWLDQSQQPRKNEYTFSTPRQVVDVNISAQLIQNPGYNLDQQIQLHHYYVNFLLQTRSFARPPLVTYKQ